MQEYNFDGLVGPNHCFSGLSLGNLASEQHRFATSNPRAAALQGLKKMKTLYDLGFPQALLPPLFRPNFSFLRQLGYSGSDEALNQQIWQEMPALAMRLFSASSMWVANAATLTPSPDSQDGRLHFTAANLHTMLHRTIEAEETSANLRQIFHNQRYFAHHNPLPQHPIFSDEGAANHTRFCRDHSSEGVHFYVYNKALNSDIAPAKYPGRQSLEASSAIARQHNTKHSVFALQNPDVVDQGVFHNDVIAVGCCDLLFCHQLAFYRQQQVYDQLRSALEQVDCSLDIIEVQTSEVDIATAIQTYLFNTQLLRKGDNYIIIAPKECQTNPKVYRYLENLQQKHHRIERVHYFDLSQSMQNGGGPACLRLRVALTEQESLELNGRVILDDSLYQDLCGWVQTHYRDRLCIEDFKDPDLIAESHQTLRQLQHILALPNLYPTTN